MGLLALDLGFLVFLLDLLKEFPAKLSAVRVAHGEVNRTG
jgi:hypothetical protein